MCNKDIITEEIMDAYAYYNKDMYYGEAEKYNVVVELEEQNFDDVVVKVTGEANCVKNYVNSILSK